MSMRLLPALLLLGLAQEEKKFFDPAVHEATRKFAYAEFLVVPVRVHLLRSAEEDVLNCRLQEKDVERIFGKVNRIWNMAGIAVRVESVVAEKAVKPDDFDPKDATLEEFKGTRPEASAAPNLIHVYYVHELPTNGVHMGADAIFVRDAARLKEAKGGVDEPIPRVTSHEIGHAFTLPHRQDTINLMASGTTGWSLNDAEVARVRTWASSRWWVLTPKEALQKKHYAVLAGIPGESEIKAKAKEALRGE